ncbi:MAG: hypothetical protein CMJ40_11265 [Phycisphaerae bacterium]|nr:hypothetical protein [Phycisphaerae bacterium]
MIELDHPESRQTLQLYPAAGCCAVSWRVEDREFLHLSQPLDRFLREEHTGGLPLLYPWANRLRSDRWSFQGRSVDLKGMPGVHRDGNGLPMHGLLLRWADWTFSSEENACTASIEWSDHERLMEAFPFSHRLQIEWSLDGKGLAVTTNIEARDEAVPISFGWHPYFVLPGVAREGVTMDLPSLFRVSLDSRGLPNDHSPEPMPAAIHELSQRAWDDCFLGIHDGSRATIRGGSIAIDFEFLEGWKAMQVYSPEDADYVCLEPMTALTAALSDGDALNCIEPGESFTAGFRLRVVDRS